MSYLRRQPRPTQVRVVATPPTSSVVGGLLGPYRHRRVWLKSDPAGRTDNLSKHWYVMAHSQMGAINDIARRMKLKPETLDSETD